MKVNITIEEFRVLDIHEVKATFDVRFWLRMEWVDPRLTFVNLKANLFLQNPFFQTTDIQTVIQFYYQQIFAQKTVWNDFS